MINYFITIIIVFIIITIENVGVGGWVVEV